MKKKLILVAAPPACGKNFVSELICGEIKNITYLDKDDLVDLLYCSFNLREEKIDMDGEFYVKNLRSAEYDTLLRLAFSALRFETLVLVNAPFIKEVRDVEYMRALKERTKALGAELVVIWVTAPIEVCYERMKKRNSNRDLLKLLEWHEYVKKVDYSAPYILQQSSAVDKLYVFDNTNSTMVEKSLKYILKKLGE